MFISYAPSSCLSFSSDSVFIILVFWCLACTVCYKHMIPSIDIILVFFMFEMQCLSIGTCIHCDFVMSIFLNLIQLLAFITFQARFTKEWFSPSLFKGGLQNTDLKRLTNYFGLILCFFFLKSIYTNNIIQYYLII